MKILIMGLPGSGKSTLAKPFAELIGGVWINADQIREKYNEIPIPDASISLDGAALRAEAQIEKDTLIEQLRQNLEELSRKNQFEIQKNTADYHQDMLRKVPLKIYVG